MSSEEELTKWLNRSEKTILENFQFGIKAWKSAEFALTTKYEIILKHITETFPQIWKLDEDENNFKNIEDFLNLKCPSPGLIGLQTKINFILIFIKVAKKLKKFDTRKICEILYHLIEYECFQDCYKQNYTEYCLIFGMIFRKYNKYLQQQYQTNETKFLTAYERDFFDKIIKNLRDFIKRLPEDCIEKFSDEFSENALIDLTEVTIVLKTNNLQYFNDILEIQKSLFLDYTTSILKNHLTLPVHVNLMNFECGLINFRGNIEFYKRLIEIVFNELQLSDEYSLPQIFLIINSYILELFKKYDVQLNFEFGEQTIIKFLSEKIENFISSYSESNLYEVLCLLCSTIRLNPLILEHNIFNITPKIFVAKKTERDYEKFEEYLILLMDMYKKLSRPEKLIANLLKSIKEHLANNQLSKKLKRKLKSISEPMTPSKIQKTDELDNSIISHTSENITSEIDGINFYLKIMLNNLCTNSKISNENINSMTINFPYITFAWNSQNIGRAFSKFISSLMSKPSLVVWKTLIYTMLEHIDTLKTFINQPQELNENLLFLIDFNASLLCQYFNGTRLIEQADKFWNEIDENRTLTCNLLKIFGQTILNLEHNNRIMNAFLEISYNCGYFDLMLWYYSPDSIVIDCLQLSKTIHNYLTSDEWTLIEQRVVNFGKKECKLNMNRIFLQRIKTKFLLQQQFNEQSDKIQLNIKKFLLSNTLDDAEYVKIIFLDPTNDWLIKYLTREQKYKICELILLESIEKGDDKHLRIFLENHEFLEIIVLNLYKNLVECFQSKKSISQLIDFNELIKSIKVNTEIDKILSIIDEKNENYVIKKYSGEDIERMLNLIKKLPIGFLKIDFKILIFSIHLALYRDLMATGNDKLISCSFEMFDDILHFGRQIEIFKYFKIEKLLKIFPPLNSVKFYEFLFHTLRKTDGNAEKCLEKIIDILKEDHPNLSVNNLKLIMILIEALSHKSNYKNFKNYLDIILNIYGDYINNFFGNEKRDPINDKIFVESTLQSISIYINSILSKASKTNESTNHITDEFRKICKIYIGYSIDSHNSYAIRLINCALNYHVQLHFDSDEIQLVMQKYWDQLKIDFKNDNTDDRNIINSEAAIKLVMMHKSPEDFRNILLEIGKDTNEKNIGYICKILTQISHCQLSLIKGAILNEHFKRITFEIILKLKKDFKTHQFENMNAIINLLKTMKILCENPKIPMSPDHIDDILTFLIHINIKKFQITDTNGKLFKELGIEMLELCTILIKYRHQIITDRIPQFSYIFKDLLQAICWYKSDRQKDSTLLTDEIEDLTELAQKMESLMHLIASHSLDVKRVAPYLLTFAISLMVTNKRSTTLYPKIKTHIESICYDLISICDHRVGSFILRCSNDAEKQVYETLCKEYKKYHKFKGKV